MHLLDLGRKKMRRQCLSSLGFFEDQISNFYRVRSSSIEFIEDKMKSNVDFLVKTMGLPLTDLVKYHICFQMTWRQD